jgi:hypothetical protein
MYSSRIQRMKAARAAAPVRQLTVRVPGDFLVRTQAIAKARGKTVTDLVRGALEALDREVREGELSRAYDLVGDDAGSNVDGAFEVQAQVARRG